jgi:hypothetical protein
MSLTKIPQNFRSKCKSGFDDYVTEVGSKIRRLDFKISRFLGEKPYRNKEEKPSYREKWVFCPLQNKPGPDGHHKPSGRAPFKKAVRTSINQCPDARYLSKRAPT